jgi:hypothetical protein
MKLNRVELEQKVIYDIQNTIKKQYGIYIEYDVLLNIAQAQFNYIKFAIENNIDKINLITVATFKKSFVKRRYKEIKSELIASGLSEHDAITTAKEYIKINIGTMANHSNVPINKRKDCKTIPLPLFK